MGQTIAPLDWLCAHSFRSALYFLSFRTISLRYTAASAWYRSWIFLCFLFAPMRSDSSFHLLARVEIAALYRSWTRPKVWSLLRWPRRLQATGLMSTEDAKKSGAWISFPSTKRFDLQYSSGWSKKTSHSIRGESLSVSLIRPSDCRGRFWKLWSLNAPMPSWTCSSTPEISSDLLWGREVVDAALTYLLSCLGGESLEVSRVQKLHFCIRSPLSSDTTG